MTHEERMGCYTPQRATHFYIPLFIQAFSQSLTYPLVASIVSHGIWGDQGFAAFAVGQNVMFMISAFGGGLVMTGMVFARTWKGYCAYIRLNNWMMGVLLSAQLLMALPPFDHLLFNKILNLPPHLAQSACDTLFWGVFMQASFFLRNVPLVILFNNRASSEATLATIVRIVLTLLAPVPFVHFGLTGARWGLVATTIPCFVEYFLSHLFARKYVSQLRLTSTPTKPTSECAFQQFLFTLPLSLGSFLLAAAPFMIAIFVNRTADGVHMLAIHYATVGLANPIAYGALRLQAVAIQFPPEYPCDRRVVRFALCVGALLGALSLIMTIPFLNHTYFYRIQNIPLAHLTFTQIVMFCYALWPLVQCLRGYYEGLAAFQKHPTAVLFGQITYLTVILLVLSLAFVCSLPGWLMGCLSILCATLATLGMVSWALARFQNKKEVEPLI